MSNAGLQIQLVHQILLTSVHENGALEKLKKSAGIPQRIYLFVVCMYYSIVYYGYRDWVNLS
jgi:hypothetical protein